MTQYFFNNITAIGRRKSASVSLSLEQGAGKISVNGISINSYFCENPIYLSQIQAPLDLLNLTNELNIRIYARGGGLSSQSKAIQLAISKGLTKYNSEFRLPLKQQGFLKTDARKKERKKYGLKKARKAPQYSKR